MRRLTNGGESSPILTLSLACDLVAQSCQNGFECFRHTTVLLLRPTNPRLIYRPAAP
jgi:hypothetical protein